MDNRNGVLPFLLVFIFAGSLFAADDVQSLIDNEQKEMSRWQSSDDELPPALMRTENNQIKIYSSDMDDANPAMLCTHLEFDQLVDLSRDAKDPTKINFSSSHVRDIFGEACLIRPGDTLMAIGPGTQKAVTIHDFFVRPSKDECERKKSDMVLWASVNEDLPFEPILFSSDPELKEADNQYRSAAQLSTLAPAGELLDQLKSHVQFLDEYTVTMFQINAANCDHIFYLRRLNVSHDDTGLPNEMLLWEKSGQFGDIAMELVQERSSSGHVHFGGVLDVNSDRHMDIFLTGDHSGCYYEAFFEGQEIGFKQIPLF